MPGGALRGPLPLGQSQTAPPGLQKEGLPGGPVSCLLIVEGGPGLLNPGP